MLITLPLCITLLLLISNSWWLPGTTKLSELDYCSISNSWELPLIFRIIISAVPASCWPYITLLSWQPAFLLFLLLLSLSSSPTSTSLNNYFYFLDDDDDNDAPLWLLVIGVDNEGVILFIQTTFELLLPTSPGLPPLTATVFRFDLNSASFWGVIPLPPSGYCCCCYRFEDELLFYC